MFASFRVKPHRIPRQKVENSCVDKCHLSKLSVLFAGYLIFYGFNNVIQPKRQRAQQTTLSFRFHVLPPFNPTVFSFVL